MYKIDINVKIDINDARYFTMIGVVVLEIFSKMTSFIESK